MAALGSYLMSSALAAYLSDVKYRAGVGWTAFHARRRPFTMFSVSSRASAGKTGLQFSLLTPVTKCRPVGLQAMHSLAQHAQKRPRRATKREGTVQEFFENFMGLNNQSRVPTNTQVRLLRRLLRRVPVNGKETNMYPKLVCTSEYTLA